VPCSDLQSIAAAALYNDWGQVGVGGLCAADVLTVSFHRVFLSTTFSLFSRVIHLLKSGVVVLN